MAFPRELLHEKFTYLAVTYHNNLHYFNKHLSWG